MLSTTTTTPRTYKCFRYMLTPP